MREMVFVTLAVVDRQLRELRVYHSGAPHASGLACCAPQIATSDQGAQSFPINFPPPSATPIYYRIQWVTLLKLIDKGPLPHDFCYYHPTKEAPKIDTLNHYGVS